MTKQQALTLLGLSAGCTQQDINSAYAERYFGCVHQLNHAMRQRERDAAAEAMPQLGQAYRVLTGASPPTHVKRPADPRKTAGRVSTPGGSASGAGCSSTATKTGPPRTSTTCRPSVASAVRPAQPWREWLVGALIYCAMCLLALLILGKGIGLTW